MFANQDELFSYIRDQKIESVDVRFTDLPGIQQHSACRSRRSVRRSSMTV